MNTENPTEGALAGTAIAAALVKAQMAYGPALKSSENPHYRSKYADLASCFDAVREALNNNGIAIIQRTLAGTHGVSVETLLIHLSGETLSGGILDIPAVKQDPQGFGSALTYARRYSLMCVCGIAPEDDDANLASKSVRPTAPASKPPVAAAAATKPQPKLSEEDDRIPF
jgi:hypothetical protein